MTDAESLGNPFALSGAPEPCHGRYDVNGCRLYAEVRGAGPPVLIIGAASDDAEMFRPIAEHLTGFTVVTWDPRGTRRSGREDWPCDSARHADDAAALVSQAASPQATRGLLDAPAGLEWYTERGAALAENFILDDLQRTNETVLPEVLAASAADIRFAAGTESPPVFREIAAELTRLRRRPGTGDPGHPDSVPGAGHVAYFTPEPVAAYIRRSCAPPT